MRKVLISLLLASAAASPALAERPHWSDNNQSTQEDRHQAREDRQSAREERSSAREERPSSNYNRPERVEPQNFTPRPQQNAGGQSQPFERRSQVRPGSLDRSAPVERSVEDFRARQQAVQGQRQDRIQERNQRLQVMRDNRDSRQADRFARTHAPVVSQVPRPGTQPPLRVEGNRAPIQWSSNWRNNSRYDWQNHRRHHRSIFHLGFYYDPFGWGYSPFQIGWRMWPNYYSSNFWINDPWYYRLPYAPPGTRWIRYYDDAILVDMWSGQVVDVIYDFFW